MKTRKMQIIDIGIKLYRDYKIKILLFLIKHTNTIIIPLHILVGIKVNLRTILANSIPCVSAS
jgi:hypothetical protein